MSESWRHPNIGPLVEDLRASFGTRASISNSVREHHGRGANTDAVMPPDVVVFAQSTDDVVRVVNLCRAYRAPLIAFGAGSSLEGQVDAHQGGVCLDLSGMNRILAVNPADLDCRVEAGVTREQLNAHLRDLGLFFPLDPGANASLGGMAATRASGTNAVRYGTMREVTLGLSVVTAQGAIIRTGGRARKSSAGYDLTRLYVGSEGTLGVITELQLRLFGIPETVLAGVCQFKDIEGAVQAVITVLQLGAPVARIELLDAVQMGACIAHSKLEGFAPVETLFLEFHGSPASVAEQAAIVADICRDFGGGDLQASTDQEARTKLWSARHNAYWAAHALRPGSASIATDACVPISALPQCILACKAEAERAGLSAPVLGHVGDGNFHMLILYDGDSSAERARAEALAHKVAQTALSFGGTITGEHGIGLHKRALLLDEHGEAVTTMRAIKRALDPDNILNPGKIFLEGE